MLAATSAFIQMRSRPYILVMAMSGSMLAVWVWVWMACLPPTRRNWPSPGMTSGSSQPGDAGKPAFTHASLVKWTFLSAVPHVVLRAYLSCFSGKVIVPFSRSSSSVMPSVCSWASASSSTVNSKYSPTPHALASSVKISSTGLVLGWIFSSTRSRRLTTGTLPPTNSGTSRRSR